MSYSANNCPNRQAGFTLVELMVSLAVLAIIAAMAAPNVQTMLQKQRNKSTAQTLVLALKEARVASLLKNQDIEVAASSAAISVGVIQKSSTSATPTTESLSYYTISNKTPVENKKTIFYANKNAQPTIYNTYCDPAKSIPGRKIHVDSNGNIFLDSEGSQC